MLEAVPLPMLAHLLTTQQLPAMTDEGPVSRTELPTSSERRFAKIMGPRIGLAAVESQLAEVGHRVWCVEGEDASWPPAPTPTRCGRCYAVQRAEARELHGRGEARAGRGGA